MGYETWPNKLLSPNSIYLDPQNPRLPSLNHNSTQPEIIKEMFEVGKAREMVKSIAKAGYFPDQRVVVIRKQGSPGKFIVVEGNRRVCACKSLRKPNIVPEQHRRFVSKWADLAEPVMPSFEKIPVVIAPNRDAATHLIVSRHLNQAPVRPWSRFAQGKFAINALEAGEDMDFVSHETGLNREAIKKAIQEARLFELLLGLKWTDEEKAILSDNLETFPIETISRVLKSPATRERIGPIEFDKDGWPKFKWDPDKTSQFLKRLVYDSMPQFSKEPDHNGKKKTLLNTRSANSSSEIAKYLDQLPEEVKPNPRAEGTSGKHFVDSAVEEKRRQEAPSTTKAKPVRSRRKRPGPALPADIECNLPNDKVRGLLDELQMIKPDDFPVATALLLRSLLEASLIARMKSVKTWEDCKSNSMPPRASNNYVPNLAKLLSFCSKCEKTIPDENLRKSLSDQRTVPKDFLNLVAHNDQHVLVASDVKEVATRLAPLLRFLLRNE